MALSLNSVFRKLILSATHNRAVARAVRQYGMQLGAGRFVAGESLDDCVRVLRRLDEQGFKTNTTLLGEGVRDAEMAARVVTDYEAVLDRIAAERLRTNVALKLTHVGLDIDEDVAYANVARLAQRAARLNSIIRIDMEESARVDVTLRIYRRLLDEGHTNIGTVLQAYLYRSEADLGSLLPLRPNLRLVKGAYLEPDYVAYPDKPDVDRAFIRLIKASLRGGGYTAIATHDERIIEGAIAFTEREGIGRERFEFQLLYGIRPQLQQDLLRRGYTVLIATPYGPDWYYYLMRRLAERPANVLFFAKNLLRG